MIANQSQVPVISFAANHIPPTLLAQTTWPSLLHMSTDVSDQIRCITDIVSSHNRRRVSIIYEAEAYDTSYPELLNSLSEELDKIGSKIEDRVILRAFSSSARVGKSFEEKLAKLKGKASPIFIVLGLSCRASGHFLKDAKKMGLFNGNSIWIFAEKPFNNLLASVENSIISTTMEGAIGLVTYCPENHASGDFKIKFMNKFHQKHGETFNFEKSIDVSRAYDCLMTVKKAIDALPTNDITPELLLARISRVRLVGLSGVIQFEKDTSKTNRRYSPQMVIGIPRTTPFGKFVKEETDNITGKATYVGFCIDIFEKASPHGLNYTFLPHEGTYEDLVNKVYDKVFPKGSPLAANFSQAILKLSESGEIKQLEDKWFPRECTMRNNTGKTPRLGLDSFWALYAFTIATSTACLLVAYLFTPRSRQVHEEVSNGDGMSQDLSIS
ncbi:hypothetical protein NL676_008277 [Syzygium grande]|nr:hypothetical protein NL676_008277 [Syzygium grande]